MVLLVQAQNVFEDVANEFAKNKAKIPKKYVKLSVSADVLFQLICTIKIRCAPTRHDTKDFPPLLIKASEILPISVTVADKGYDSENNIKTGQQHCLGKLAYVYLIRLCP